MGSAGSRARPPRARDDHRGARRGIASFLCGAASSSSSIQMENEAAEKLVIPAGQHDSMLSNHHQISVKESPLNFSSESCASSSTNGHLRSCPSSDTGVKESMIDLRNIENSDSGKLSKSKELVPCMANSISGLDRTYSERNYDLASTSAKSEALEPFLANLDTPFTSVVENVDSTSGCGSQPPPATRLSSGTSPLQPVDLPANEMLSAGSTTNEAPGLLNSVPTSISIVSDSSESRQLLGEEPLLEAIPSGAASLTYGGSGEQRNESVLHLDVVSISGMLPTSGGEVSTNEARRYSRRMFWDAFSRRTSRRINNSPSMYLSTADVDDLESHDRLLLDISDDFLENEIIDDDVFLRRRRRGASGLRWYSRSEIRERLRSGLDDNSGRTTFCPSGLHPDGTCSCYSFLVAEESSTRASISRIVMLAEALFEVLDEIHRQPVSLSLSVVSLPAPESVVNSLPIKSYKKLKTGGNGEDEEQCYICLSEYEEEDSIRVLPCCHEYHTSCIDKWLKEIHGVCPLCRADVCEGATEGSIS